MVNDLCLCSFGLLPIIKDLFETIAHLHIHLRRERSKEPNNHLCLTADSKITWD